MIEISERKGTADIQPHSAILRGEQMNRIIIKNDTKPYYPKLVVRVFSSATVWEFVDKVSRMCDLAPQFVDVTLSGGKKVKDSDYGKTLAEIGMRNHDIITVKKNRNETPDVPQVPLIDPTTNELVPKAAELFAHWHALYSDNTGIMTPKSATRFILGATNEHIGETDGRIKGLFDGYDADKDGKM